jgi:urate oxidase
MVLHLSMPQDSSTPASLKLSDCGYGKSGVRLLKVERHGTRHEVKDIDVAIRVFGAFENAYTEGNNRFVLPTDTMKNTVYVLARLQPLGEIESFGVNIANHFLMRNPHLTRARIMISEHIWERIICNGQPQDSSFRMSGSENRTAVIDANRTNTLVQGGIRNLVVLKTSKSGFQDFLRDEYTTLKDTSDRLLSSIVNAEWSYSSAVTDFTNAWASVRATLLNTFAAHESSSVQHTLYAMAQAVLQAFNTIERITLSMPNRHCIPVDLSSFGMANPNEIFLPVEEPSGLIEATVERGAKVSPQ